jgi:hypothetical protein
MNKHYENKMLEVNCNKVDINTGWSDSTELYPPDVEETKTYCSECRKIIDISWNYCPHCGYNLKSNDYKKGLNIDNSTKGG